MRLHATPRRRALTSAATAVAAAASLVAGLAVSVAPAAGAQTTTDITVLNVNDFHGRLAQSSPSTLAFAETVEQKRAQYGETSTIFASAGDNIGASLFASAFKDDQPTIELLNALDLDVSAVGNHEFDKGTADLSDRVMAAAEWDYLAANVSVNGTPVKGFEIIERDGVRVGVIGAVTDETPAMVAPSLVQGTVFTDMIEAVNRVAAQLTDGDEANGEADVLVAEYHDGAATGTDLAAAKGSEIFARIVDETSPEVDAILTAHTHQQYVFDAPVPGGEGTRPVVQSGSYASHLGRVTLSVDTATKDVVAHTAENIVIPKEPAGLEAQYPRVAAAKAILDATLAEADVVGRQPVGRVTGDITTAHADGRRDDRLSESTLGNLVGEFLVDAAAERGGADIGLTNPGGLRAELMNDPAGEPGNITKAEANGVLPFANTLVLLDLTGAQLKEVLEEQWQPADSSRPFLALGANKDFTWTFDPTRPEGDRITSMTLAGKPIDPAATYTVSTASFLAGGGDNFTTFAEGTNVRDTGLVDSEAWMAFLGKNAEQGLAPDYSRRAVAAKNLPTTVEAGTEVSFTLTDLDLTSLGVTPAKTATVALGTTELGTVDVVTGPDTANFGAGAFPTPLDGRADITVTIPADAPAGARTLTVTTDTGTVVTIPVAVTGAAGEPTEPGDDAVLTGSAGSLAAMGFARSGLLDPTSELGSLAAASVG